MAVVSNSSPLIALTQIGRLDLLGRLHARVLIPPAVAKEIEPTMMVCAAFTGSDHYRVTDHFSDMRLNVQVDCSPKSNFRILGSRRRFHDPCVTAIFCLMFPPKQVMST